MVLSCKGQNILHRLKKNFKSPYLKYINFCGLLITEGIQAYLSKRQLMEMSAAKVKLTGNGTRSIMKDRVSWILLQKELLEKERLAEVEASTVQVEDVALKQLEAKGIAISHLSITECSTGLFGRPTVTLIPKCKQGITPTLPSHSFSSGDIVGIWGSGINHEAQIASGVVSKLTSSSIQIALDDETPELDQLPDDALVTIHKLANDVTYRRLKDGLELVRKMVGSSSSHLMEVLFREAEPFEPLVLVPSKLLTKTGELDLFNKHLDDSQVDAVKFALVRKELAVVHGPPGTGKTTTLVEIILQHVKLGCKVLAVAPSNLAVDNLLERLLESKVSVVRVGHPARATPKAQQRTLDALIQKSEEIAVIEDIHKDIKSSLLNLSKTREKGKRVRLREDVKHFRKELKEREMRLSRDILSRSQVILTTLTSAGNAGPLKLLEKDHFDLAVIDECSQGLECACYLSAMRAPKLLLAGDHHQLPPTILSTEAAKAGFLISLMERIVDTYKNRVTKMLNTQYRMNSTIMEWASEALYEGQLKAHFSVGTHLLCQMEGVRTNEDTENALVLIDTAGCNFEEVSGDDLSKGNEGEAAIVAEQVKTLINSGVKETEVAVISPYNLQVEMIRTLLRDFHPLVEVRSVDGFQGREKEVVVLSLVRSNKQGEIGFLSEDRRLNVAVTRARRQLTLVCDTDTVGRHDFIRSLVDHITVNGIVKSGHEFESAAIEGGSPSFKMVIRETSKPIKTKSKEEKKAKKKQPQNSEEENENRKKDFEIKILEFIKNEEIFCLEFPKNLNSFERLLVHEIAAKNGLIHDSRGEGKERFIVLRKMKGDEGHQTEDESQWLRNEGLHNENEDKLLNMELVSKENEVENKNLVSKPVQKSSKQVKNKENLSHTDTINSETKHEGSKTINSETKHEESKHTNSETKQAEKAVVALASNLPTKLCAICKSEIIVKNFELHVLRCEKLVKEREIKSEINKRQTEIKGVKKKKQKEKYEERDNDFDIMEKYAKENNSCAFPRCKNPSILLLQLCYFCRNNFCLKHHQAEIHGCREEAKQHARTVLISSVRNGVLTPGSGVPSKKPDPVKRQQLHRKLDRKLGEMGNERKNKKK